MMMFLCILVFMSSLSFYAGTRMGIWSVQPKSHNCIHELLRYTRQYKVLTQRINSATSFTDKVAVTIDVREYDKTIKKAIDEFNIYWGYIDYTDYPPVDISPLNDAEFEN